MDHQVWDTKLKLLHWAIVITATFQMITSAFMSDEPTQFLLPFHQWVGLAGALVVTIFWLHSFAVYDLPLLFPWNRAGIRAVFGEVQGLLHGRLPLTGRRVGLSSFVHGLGLLALTGAAATGLVMFSMVPPGHQGPPADAAAFTRYTLQHKFFGELLWAYWLGHAGFAFLHQLTGHSVLGSIFGFGSGQARSQRQDTEQKNVARE